MTDPKMEKILRIARSTRRWAKRTVKQTVFQNDNLGGFCAIGAVRLFQNLRKEGVNAKLAVTHSTWGGHCYVLVDNYIVDVTATQFGQEPVLIVSTKEAYKRSTPFLPHPWSKRKVYDSVSEFHSLLKRTGWGGCHKSVKAAKPGGVDKW